MLTTVAAAVQSVLNRRDRKKLQNLARQFEMHYAPGDRLRLTNRVAEQFPFPGAFDVRVRNLIFRTERHQHEYAFMIEYGTGVIRGKRRRIRVGGFTEPVTRSGVGPANSCNLVLAPPELSIEEQYRRVIEILDQSIPR